MAAACTCSMGRMNENNTTDRMSLSAKKMDGMTTSEGSISFMARRT